MKTNWLEIEHVYITGDYTHKEIAHKFNVNVATLRNNASKFKWKEKRDKFREDAKKALNAESLKIKVMERQTFDSIAERACDIAVSQIAVKFTDSQNAKTKIGGRTLNEYLMALMKAVDTKYKIMGVPPPKQALSIEAEAAFNVYQTALAVETAKIVQVGEQDSEDEYVAIELERPVIPN